MSELKQALQKSNNSAAGPDEVHYNLLTHLLESILSVRLKVYNYLGIRNLPSLVERSSRGSHCQSM